MITELIEGGSSIGRVPVSKTGCCRFESCPPCSCGRSSVVERLLAKEKVVSSSLIARSFLRLELRTMGNCVMAAQMPLEHPV